MRRSGTSAGKGLVDRAFPALRQRDFRIFWIGQCVSVIGTWMQDVGQSWLVLEMTGSSSKLGLVTALQFLPVLFFSVFAGPVVDRFPKRRIIILTQAALAFLALLLAVLVATGTARYWMILVMALLLGMVQLVDAPARQSFIAELAGRDTLMNAVSLNSAAFNLARTLGPAIAGLLIGAIGIAPCFFLNALSFVAVIAALLAVKVPDRAAVPARTGAGPAAILRSAGEGLSYVRERPRIALPLVLLALISTFVINYSIFVPTFARIDLGRSADGYGFLMSALGAGSLLAALTLAVRSSSGPKPATLLMGAAGCSAALLACGLQRSYWGSLAILFLVGFCTISLTASTNATIQLASDDEHRGRVMSLYSLVFGGVTPIGAIWAGETAARFGPAASMVLSGAVGLVSVAGVALLVARRRKGG